MIGILIFPDFQLLDAAGPISAFEVAARAAPASRLRCGCWRSMRDPCAARRASR